MTLKKTKKSTPTSPPAPAPAPRREASPEATPVAEPAVQPVSLGELHQIAHGEHGNPHGVLGRWPAPSRSGGAPGRTPARSS
jgi:hypothetical protein